MKTYKLLIDRFTETVMVRVAQFIEEASHIEGVSVNDSDFSVTFEPEKERVIKEMCAKYDIVDLTLKES